MFYKYNFNTTNSMPNTALNNEPEQHRAKDNCKSHSIHLVHFFLVCYEHKKCNNKLQCCIVRFRQLTKQLFHHV